MIQNLVGDTTFEELKYVDYYVSNDLGIFIPSVGFCEYATKPRHTHPANSLILIFDEKTADTLHIPLSIKPDPLYYFAAFLPPGIPHEEEKTTMFSRYMAIMVSEDLFQEVLNCYDQTLPYMIDWKSFLLSKDIMILLNRFMDEYEEKKPGFEAVLTNLSALIIHEFIRAMLGNIDSKKSLRPHGIQTALDYIHQNYMEPISILSLAEVTAMSSASFKRYFKKEMQSSPIQYIIRFRLEKSKKLLRSKSIDISGIAISCGFSSASHFTSCFKKHFKITPSQYRNLYLGDWG